MYPARMLATSFTTINAYKHVPIVHIRMGNPAWIANRGASSALLPLAPNVWIPIMYMRIDATVSATQSAKDSQL